MGIRGLDKYIRSHDMTEDFYFPRDPLSNLCDSLLDCYLDSAVDSNETHVENHTYDQIPIVISGRSLMHFLYRENLECILGGQYEKFKEIILEFFNSLKRYQIKVEGIVFNCKYQEIESFPLYVFNNMKESQRRASIAMRKMINQRFEFDQPVRHTSFGPPLPLLTLPVMINTLTQLQLPLYLSKGNCDEGIVILANEKNSYILAEDSDFAIYPLSKGYFLLDTLELKEEGVCKLFRSHLALAEKWELDVSYLGLYAVMMGSNLLPTLYLQKFCKRFPWDCTSLLHTHVLELLLEYQSKGLTANQAATTFLEDECCHSTHADFDPSWNLFHDCFYKAIASYKFEEKTSKVEAFSSSDPYGYGLGLEHHLFCPEVVVEPTWRQCVWNVSRPLRRRGYARLLQKESQVLPTIKELIRNHEDFSYKFCDVQPLLDLTLPFNLEEEPNGIFFILHWLMLNNELNLDAFFAFVISFHQKPPSPMVQWSKETYTIDSFRYLALFETCMVSWHVATGKLLYHLIEGPSFHYFYSQIQILHPKKISSVLKNLVQKDQLKTFLDWMYKILGDFLDTSLLVKKNDTWILDWPPSRNE